MFSKAVHCESIFMMAQSEKVNLIPELRIVPFVVEVTQFMDDQIVDDACGCHHDLPVEIDFPFFI
jgi:hypothetical protein